MQFQCSAMASLPTIRSAVFFVVLVVVLFSSTEIDASGNVGEVLPKGLHEQKEFDFFTFALSWVPTYCHLGACVCPRILIRNNPFACSPGTPPRFVVHGLWPDYNDGTWPQCCTSEKLDLNQIGLLICNMKDYWPSLTCWPPHLTCEGVRGGVWDSQWEKHGTCGAPVIESQYGYFSMAFSLYNTYNVTEVLEEAGYIPSDSEKYPFEGIFTAIKNAASGATPTLKCSGDALQQVQFCFSKDFKIQDCAGRNSSCPTDIRLPKSICGRGKDEGKLHNILDHHQFE